MVFKAEAQMQASLYQKAEAAVILNTARRDMA